MKKYLILFICLISALMPLIGQKMTILTTGIPRIDGTIVSNTKDSLCINADIFGFICISQKTVKSIYPIEENEVITENIALMYASEYFFNQSAFTLGEGSLLYANKQFINNKLSYGITRYLNVDIGSGRIFSENSVFAGIKAGFRIFDHWRLGFKINAGSIFELNHFYVEKSVFTTIGTIDNNVSFGISHTKLPSDPQTDDFNGWMYNMNTSHRLNDKFIFILETEYEAKTRSIIRTSVKHRFRKYLLFYGLGFSFRNMDVVFNNENLNKPNYAEPMLLIGVATPLSKR